MAARKLPPTTPPPGTSTGPLQVVHPDAAGIDVHSDMHMVAIPPGRLPDGPVRAFGANTATATVILGETGGDVSRFPTPKHFASWLGLCPRQHQSNKTSQKRGPRRGKNRVAHALRLAARSIGRTTTPLGLFYRRIKSRTGPAGAITATAHKLARRIYALLKHGTAYVQRSQAKDAARLRAHQEQSLRRRARSLGFDLVAQSSPPAT